MTKPALTLSDIETHREHLSETQYHRWLVNVAREYGWKQTWVDFAESSPNAYRLMVGAAETYLRGLLDPQEYYERYLKPPETRLAPLWWRAWMALTLAVRIWTPPGFKTEDPWESITLRLAFTVAWGIHHDDHWRSR